MASRKLTDLSPAVEAMAIKFLSDCSDDPWFQRNGISVLITCTYRSGQEQDMLYAQGRTTPGRIVTNAKAGQSWHNAVDVHSLPAAEAFDFVPLRAGKPVWGTSGDGVDDDPSDDHKDDLEVWQRCGAHAVNCGLNWYGSPGSSFKEFPHCQNPSPTMIRSEA